VGLVQKRVGASSIEYDTEKGGLLEEKSPSGCEKEEGGLGKRIRSNAAGKKGLRGKRGRPGPRRKKRST